MPDSAAPNDFLDSLDTDVYRMMGRRRYTVEVTETTTVPRIDDSALTFDEPDAGIKRAKRLTTCVLYVDIRDSTQISAEHRPKKLTRLYSTFVHVMIRCAREGGGHVRNIIGDRVMIVFDADRCFERAAHTATLCNTAAHQIIQSWSRHFVFRCGIGIDHGPLLVTKAGVPRRGAETEFYRSLVWLGRPANVASKLTDLANKSTTESAAGRRPAVLVTEEVLDGLHQQLDLDHPAYDGWVYQPVSVPGYDGSIYGCSPEFDLMY